MHESRRRDPDEHFAAAPSHAIVRTDEIANDLFSLAQHYRRLGLERYELWSEQHMADLFDAYASEALTLNWMKREFYKSELGL